MKTIFIIIEIALLSMGLTLLFLGNWIDASISILLATVLKIVGGTIEELII